MALLRSWDGLSGDAHKKRRLWPRGVWFAFELGLIWFAISAGLPPGGRVVRRRKPWQRLVRAAAQPLKRLGFAGGA